MKRKQIRVQEQNSSQSSVEGLAEAGGLGHLEEDDSDNEKNSVFHSIMS